MRFSVPPEYDALRRQLVRFIEDEVRPLEAELDPETDEIPSELLLRVRRRSAELAFYGAGFPREVGGRGLSQLGVVLLREAAEKTGARLASAVIGHVEGPTAILLRGTKEQREQYLAPLVRAEKTRCMAVTEPTAGSDAQGIRTSAVQSNGHWVLSGDKHLIGNAAQADFAIVLAVTDAARGARGGVTAFIVDKGTPGFEVVRRQRGMLESTQLFEVRFRDCRVPPEKILGGPASLGMGFAMAMESFATGRLTIAAECNGIAEFALSLGLQRAKSRMAFGRPIGANQYVQGHIVDSSVELSASRLLAYQCAWRADQGQEIVQESSIAKLYASEMVNRVVDRMIQVHGGEGWLKGPLERLYRRVRCLRILEGPSEIQKVIIADTLGLPR